MNDKTSIFLCCLFPQLLVSFSREIHIRIKNSFVKCDRIDGVFARESSNGNRILCLKGISFHFPFLLGDHRSATQTSFSIQENGESRINSHADEYVKSFLLLNRNCEICEALKHEFSNTQRTLKFLFAFCFGSELIAILMHSTFLLLILFLTFFLSEIITSYRFIVDKFSKAFNVKGKNEEELEKFKNFEI